MGYPMFPHALSLRYLLRMMDVLEGQGEMTLTNIAMLSRINHKRCTELVEHLRTAGHLEAIWVGNRRYFRLTQKGGQYAKKLREVGELSEMIL